MLAAMVAAALLPGQPAAAAIGWQLAALQGDEAVRAGREALGGRPDFPWYDKQADQLRRVEVPPPNDPAHRDSDWQSSPRESRNLGEGLGLAQLAQVLAWVLLGGLLAALVLLLVRALLKSEAQAIQGADTAAAAADVDRVENLPFQVQRPQSDLLAEARRHYEQGNYDEAILYLYSYQLVQLDKYHLIHLAKGKTNRQYLRELRGRAGLVPDLERSMVAFEDVFFGHHTLDRQRFDACWQGLERFQQHLEHGEPVAV